MLLHLSDCSVSDRKWTHTLVFSTYFLLSKEFLPRHHSNSFNKKGIIVFMGDIYSMFPLEGPTKWAGNVHLDHDLRRTCMSLCLGDSRVNLHIHFSHIFWEERDLKHPVKKFSNFQNYTNSSYFIWMGKHSFNFNF